MRCGRNNRVPSTNRIWLALVLLCAVLARGAIPTGWMPNVDGGPGGPLILCPAAGPDLPHAIHHHGHAGHSHGAREHDVCAFAGLAAAPDPVIVSCLPPISCAGIAALGIAPESIVFAERGHREQAARAPPLLV